MHLEHQAVPVALKSQAAVASQFMLGKCGAAAGLIGFRDLPTSSHVTRGRGL